MRAFLSLGALFPLIGLSNAGAYPPDVVDKLAQDSLPKLKEYLAKNPQGNCTYENAVKRREWGDLSPQERKEYTDAVLCLQSKPAITSDVAPGAKSRFDDYIVVHIQQTNRNHGSTFFLPWHRYYIWHYENALRTECGYKGYQPYWNWGRYAQDPINSPLFNGDEYSLGGNGAKSAYSGIPIGMTGGIPAAEGGGCVTTGPFKNMTVNLGPIAPAPLGDIKRNPRADGMGYNPRCLRRDVNKNSAAMTTANHTYSLITENNNAHWFQTVMEASQLPQQGGKWGVHIGGHYTVGGDPGGDFYVSPGDPAFWLHHSMIDRVWWIWQMQDLEKRLVEVSKTMTMENFPPSRNGTLDDLSGLGVLAPDVKVRDLMLTMGGLDGKFCYVYE